jgi:hypothetical protein
LIILNSVLASLLISLQPPKTGRECRGDLYFVDVPVWAVPPSIAPATFSTQLVTSLNASMQVGWFCGPDGPSCQDPSTVPAISASVTTVLAPRTVSGVSWRNDGHQRFYRVSYSSSADPTRTPLWARPTFTCEVIRQLRQSVDAIVPTATMWIGRDCEASGHTSPMEATPDSDMLEWHLERLGVPTAAQPASIVDLVLIDSGVDPLARASLDVTQSRAFGAPAAAHHPHGSGMASLIRRIAQRTALYDFRVLDDKGHSTTAPLAQAIDAALFEVKSRTRPMIINLSLGWPRVFSEYNDIAFSGCSTWEDPSGEAVRYLIHGSGLSDRATVIAAAGNDPTSGAPFHGAQNPPPGEPTPPTCAALSNRSGWFYPAQWDSTPSCFSAGQQTKSVIAVSGTNDREQMSAIAVPDDESPLVAPSDHVYATIPGVPANSALTCPSAIAVRGVESPLVFSGSSVSSALVSAAAARVQELRHAAGASVLSSSDVEKLLYLTGESLCRNNGDNVLIRRLHLGRLARAFLEPNCVHSLLTCSAGGSEVGPTTFTSCTTAIDTCGLGPAAGTCPIDQEAIGWSAGPSTPACGGTFNIAPPLDPCPPTLCPLIEAPNRVLLGSTGPQPNTGGCPDCLFERGATAWTLHAELSSNFPLGTTFSEPRIEVIEQSGALSEIKLVPPTPATAWVPGASLQIEISPATLSPSIPVKQIKAKLVMTILQGGVSGTDYSVLRVASAP